MVKSCHKCAFFWKNMLKALIESMIIHSHYAQELLLSTLLSLPIITLVNYRGIALTSCLNKVMEWVILFNIMINYKQATCSLPIKKTIPYLCARWH